MSFLERWLGLHREASWTSIFTHTASTLVACVATVFNVLVVNWAWNIGFNLAAVFGVVNLLGIWCAAFMGRFSVRLDKRYFAAVQAADQGGVQD